MYNREIEFLFDKIFNFQNFFLPIPLKRDFDGIENRGEMSFFEIPPRRDFDANSVNNKS